MFSKLCHCKGIGMPHPDLKGKVAIVTGSSSGIGRATAVEFAKEGCNVTLTGRNLERLEDAKKQCIKAGLKNDQVLCVPGDVTNHDYLASLVDKTVAKFGKLDVLVNNAGAMKMASIMQADISEFQNMIDVNLKSVIQLSKLAMPHLIKTKGNIVNVSTVGARHSVVLFGYYGIAKAGVDHFTDMLAMEVAAHGVRVNTVNPGGIETNLTSEIPGLSLDAMKKMQEQLVPLQRIGQPEEIAKPILFLASDDASYITGECLVVDGGFLHKPNMPGNLQPSK